MTDEGEFDYEAEFAINRMEQVKKDATAQKKRAKVLVYASSIDSELSELLAKSFVGSGGIKSNKLLNSQKAGALSFSAKIELAYRLGMISNRLRGQLNMIRTFRNECAHVEDDFDFDLTENRTRIEGAFLELSKDVGGAFFKGKRTDYEGKFDSLCSLMLLMLRRAIAYQPKFPECELEPIYTHVNKKTKKQKD